MKITNLITAVNASHDAFIKRHGVAATHCLVNNLDLLDLELDMLTVTTKPATGVRHLCGLIVIPTDDTQPPRVALL